MEETKKKKVLIIYNHLIHYRIPITKLLAEKCDLTVVYSLGSDPKEEFNFKVIKLPVIKFNRFVIHKTNLYKICQNFDVVIAYGDIAWLKLSGLAFRKKRRFKLLFWTIGVSASYDKKFDAVSRWDSVRDLFYKKADGLIFYTDYPIQKYISRGYKENKLFVAPNTVEVFQGEKAKMNNKDIILFIGTLYMQKGILSLLENYKFAYDINQNIFPLIIIGGGPEFEEINSWITNNQLHEKVYLKGPIYDVNVKAEYFQRSLACISPFQAGLTVLESMGYGVPFITMFDAITGGERLNIVNNINGILMQKSDELRDILLDISNNEDKYIIMGANALKKYNSSRTPMHMANGLFEAINNV